MFIRAFFVVMLASSAFADPPRPITRITPGDSSYSYTVAVLNERGGETAPAPVDQAFNLRGKINGRIVVWRNTMSSDFNPLGLVMNINGALYFAPLHFLTLTGAPVSSQISEGEDAGIYLTVRGLRLDPFSQRREQVSFRLKVSTLDGQPLDTLLVEEYDHESAGGPAD